MKMNFALLFLTLSTFSFALDYTPVRMAVWAKGESILGEEFTAPSEHVVDYLSKLPRPEATSLTPFKFNCQAKMRRIRPEVQMIGGGTTNRGWVEIRTVYDLKDCVQITD